MSISTNTDPTAAVGRFNRYPAPFLDLATTYMPVNIKSLFRLCRFYASSHHLVHPAIVRLSAYPITDLLIEHGDKKYEENWKRLLMDHLDIRGFTRVMNLDYYCYGNSFSMIYYPFRRWFICQAEGCGVYTMSRAIGIRITGRGTLEGNCPACLKDKVEFEIFDVPERNIRKLRLLRIDPMNIDIKYLSITGEKRYVFNVPNRDRQLIRDGDADAIATSPAVFIEAVTKNKRVTLDDTQIFHHARPSVSGEQMEWGLPLIFPIMRLLFVTQIFLKAREAIAIEHAVPMRFLYPDQGVINPAEEIDLGRWSDQVIEELRKWRRDPNHIAIAPIKLGQVFVGGDANALSVAQDLEFLEKDIAAGMMVPIEFLFGGLSFSGSSVSLRMLENDFINNRKDLERMINSFMIRNIAKFLGWPEAKAKFSDMRTSDDVQKQQLILQLLESQQISTKTALHAFGYDLHDEQQQILKEMEILSQILVKQAEAQADAEGHRAIKAMEYTVKANVQAQQMQEQEMQTLLNSGVAPDQVEMMGQKLDAAGASQMSPDLMHNYVMGGRDGGGKAPSKNGASNGAGGDDMQSVFVEELKSMSEAQRRSSLDRIKKKHPAAHDEILNKINSEKKVDLKPLPEKNPPRRKKSPM